MHEELRGRVNEFGEACVDIRFLSNNMTYSFLIDTGFNGSLCLPAGTAEELKLNLEEQTTFTELATITKILILDILKSNGWEKYRKFRF
jgi:predicted aspartyl protease